MRIFQLHREVDETGSSGTGVVVQGVEFDDGTVALRWLTETTSTAVYASMQDVVTIHGHNGATRVVWLDYGGQPLADTPTPPATTGRGFGVWADFTDLYGKSVDVAGSSLATEDAVWIHAEGGAAHLDAAMAAQVRDALNAWLLWLGNAAAWNPTGATA